MRAGGDLSQCLKRGRCVHPISGRASGVPLRGDYGFGDRNDDLIGSRGGLRRVGGAHGGSPHVMGRRTPNFGEGHSRSGRLLLSARANPLPIPANRAAGRPAQGLDESRLTAASHPMRGGKARRSHDGEYWQAFGRKKQARVACRPVSGRAPQNARRGRSSRIVPWREGTRRVPPLLRRAFAARSFFCAWGERAAPSGPATSSSLERCTGPKWLRISLLIGRRL